MTDFLFLLAKTNLAMAGAIIVVALLRRPVRAAFHAPIAYGLWLLVPAAMLASLLPPRMVAAPAHPALMAVARALHPARAGLASVALTPFDWSLMLFIGWMIGMAGMALAMAWQQYRFHKAERCGTAGPAVTGFISPRIVVPAGFSAQFSAPEQAAILAHETAHLARQDARVNAIVAGLRCVCWFNPLAHLGALWLRKDQELACDAAALKRVPRIDYANALLKSQLRAIALPLGCSWPGDEHPLTERMVLLKRTPPAQGRQAVGVALILSLTVFAGVGTWAAEPRQAAGGRHNFTGVIFYAEGDGSSGQPLFLSLESDDGRNANGKPMLGHELLHFPYGVAWADSAALSPGFNAREGIDAKTITLSGNVTLLWGQSGLDGQHGQKLVFDARTGLLDFDGKTMPSGMPKYRPCAKNCKRF